MFRLSEKTGVYTREKVNWQKIFGLIIDFFRN